MYEHMEDVSDSNELEREIEPLPPREPLHSLKRDVLGRPGSIRRWLVGSAAFLCITYVVYLYSNLLGRILLFIVAALMVMTAFRARRFLIGDEDEVRPPLWHHRTRA